MTEVKRFKEATWWPRYLEAKPLELFVNLEESANAFTEAHRDFENEERQPVTPAEFRKAYPDFVPAGWWEYRSDADAVTSRFDGDIARFGAEVVRERWEPTQWQTTQASLRSAWDRGFSLEPRDLIILVTLVFDPQELNEGDRPLLGSILQIDPESTYYKSLVWLNSQPWRAGTCQLCKRRFIASWPSNDEYCSRHCKKVGLREYKREYRKARAKKYNANRRKARAKMKRTKC
jgi:hypothetical protein